MRIIASLIFFLSLAYHPPLAAGAPATLVIRNLSQSDILNVLVSPLKAKDFFLRLDLAPGSADTVDNPGGDANLRVDTGMEFWFFNNVDLLQARELDFCGEHPVCLDIVNGEGKHLHLNGISRSLVPEAGQKPVCELDRFRPRMPMGDVCAVLSPDLPVDDNGAILTGLGFAGMLWAGRLNPAQNGPVGAQAPLEHLELRHKLSASALKKLLDSLYARGYAPWQAEFPGQDIDFADMASGLEARKEILAEAIAKFDARYQSPAATAGKIAFNPKDDEPEARILMAPMDILPALANADDPQSDVQLFTIVLHPVTGVLLVDVAAYSGERSTP